MTATEEIMKIVTDHPELLDEVTAKAAELLEKQQSEQR